mgnify:FL=1
MFAYWIFFLLPGIVILSPYKFKKNLDTNYWYVVFLIFIFIIGFRYNVGGDWPQYKHVYTMFSKDFDILNFRIGSDYGYEFLAWFVYQLNFKFYGLNLIISVIFTSSIFYFCYLQPNKWVALVVSYPVIILILGMGFTRQGVAFAMLVFGIIALIKKHHALFFLCMFISIIFHKSTIIFLPLYFFSFEKIKFSTLIIFSIFLLAAVYLTYEDLYRLYESYVLARFTNAEAGGGLVSNGVYYRVGLNLIAAIFMLLFRKELTKNIIERRIFVSFALVTIFSIFLMNDFSVLSDRMNLYLSILQVFVFSRLFYVFKGEKNIKTLNILIFFNYGLILTVWLLFAVNSHAWIPYMNVFFNVHYNHYGELNNDSD